MPHSRPNSDIFTRTVSVLEAREQELLRELEQVRKAKHALQPLSPQARTATTNLATMRFEMTSAPEVSFVEMARRVLVNAGAPLGIRQLVEGVRIGGLGRGKTFEEVRASLTPALIRRRDLFVKLKRGVYGLREQAGEQAKGKD